VKGSLWGGGGAKTLLARKNEEPPQQKFEGRIARPGGLGEVAPQKIRSKRGKENACPKTTEKPVQGQRSGNAADKKERTTVKLQNSPERLGAPRDSTSLGI